MSGNVAASTGRSQIERPCVAARKSRLGAKNFRSCTEQFGRPVSHVAHAPPPFVERKIPTSQPIHTVSGFAESTAIALTGLACARPVERLTHVVPPSVVRKT